MVLRSFPVVYASDVERAATFWELIGFTRHVQLPDTGHPGYVGLRRAEGELAVTSAEWATERYGMRLGEGPRFEMYVYVDNLDELVESLRRRGVSVLRDPDDMPWGERIATVSDPDGNPVALCATARVSPGRSG